jgi:hypothetical protein
MRGTNNYQCKNLYGIVLMRGTHNYQCKKLYSIVHRIKELINTSVIFYSTGPRREKANICHQIYSSETRIVAGRGSKRERNDGATTLSTMTLSMATFSVKVKRLHSD